MYIEQFQKNDAFESPQPTKNLLIPPSPGKVLSPPNTYIHSLTKFWFLSGKGQPPTK